MALPTRVSHYQYRDPTESAQREFDSMLGRFFGNREANGGSTLFAPFGVDVREDGDHLYVEAELPGFKKDEVDITLENQTLTIVAERKQERKGGESAKGEYLLQERRYTRFQRSFTLPPTVSEQSVDAKLADGMLTIKLQKREELKPRKIQLG